MLFQSQLRYFHSPGGSATKTEFLSSHVDIYLPIYNLVRIPGLQTTQSQIPGLRKPIREWNPYAQDTHTRNPYQKTAKKKQSMPIRYQKLKPKKNLVSNSCQNPASVVLSVASQYTLTGCGDLASLGSRPRLAGSLCQVIVAYALRLNSRAGTEGSTVSCLICDRWLILGLETLSISRCLNH